MHISEVRLRLSWSTGFVYLESCARTLDTSFPLSKHSGGGDTAPTFSGLCVLFTVHVGNVSSTLSCGIFLPLQLLQAFLLLVAGCAPLLLPEPLWPGPACSFTVLGRIPLPASS
jgi:hypothetical protein